MTSILKPNPEEVLEQLHSALRDLQPEDLQPIAFIGFDENYFQKAVKMLCTNYDLESTL